MDLSAAFKTVSVGEPVTFQNLTVFPLLAQRGAEAAYLTLDAALATGGLSVTGVSHGGSVPDLLVTNRLDRPVLLLDGEEVIGAKQNRVFNLSILVAARSKTVVPVSCVEAGRWSQVSPLLAASQRTQHSTGRAERLLQVSESLAALQSRRSDQGRVWQEIARKSAQMAVDSPTGAMADIYERFSAPVDRFVAAIAPVESQCGAVFAMNSTISGVELFDSPSTLKALLPKLVRSYALDAIEAAPAPGEETHAEAPDTGAATAFLQEVSAAAVQSFPAAGLGEDLRLNGAAVAGACLAVDGKLVHLCAFRVGAPGAAGPEKPGMVRAALRRRFAESFWR